MLRAKSSLLHLQLFLKPPECLCNLIVQGLKFSSHVLLGLRIGRLELHLRELEHDVASRIANLHNSSIRTVDREEGGEREGMKEPAKWQWIRGGGTGEERGPDGWGGLGVRIYSP